MGSWPQDMRAKKGASSSPYAFQVYHNLQFLWDKLAHCGCTRSPWNWAVALDVRVSGGSLKGEFEQNYDRTLRPECAAKIVNKSLRATFLPSFLTATGHFLASFLPRKGKSKRFLGCKQAVRRYPVMPNARKGLDRNCRNFHNSTSAFQNTEDTEATERR